MVPTTDGCTMLPSVLCLARLICCPVDLCSERCRDAMPQQRARCCDVLGHFTLDSLTWHARGSSSRLCHGLARRPQRFVRDLVLRRDLCGRVLDLGCGIGDNALHIAKACPETEVVAVDMVRKGRKGSGLGCGHGRERRRFLPCPNASPTAPCAAASRPWPRD